MRFDCIHCRKATTKPQSVKGAFLRMLTDQEQSPVITSFYYPTADFNFKDFYQKLKAKGFVIYPGKISQADTFRIGNIGDVFPTDFERLIEAVKELQLQ